MVWSEIGVWKSLNDIFSPAPQRQVASDAMDTPDWIKEWVSQFKPEETEAYQLETPAWIKHWVAEEYKPAPRWDILTVGLIAIGLAILLGVIEL